MCVYNYTHYEKCGCYRPHTIVPCPNAFDSEMLTCNPSSFVQREKADAYCPECKSVFDNKDPRESWIMRLPQMKIMQEVHPRLGVSCERSTLHRESPRSTVSPDQHQLKGTLAEIDQQHNQFRNLPRCERLDDKFYAFLKWVNEPQHPAPANDKHMHLADHGHKITPSPLPTPPTTMARTLSVRVNKKYDLRSRYLRLSASQQKAMARAGYDHIRRLSIISRREIRVCRHIFSASQRDALARAGFPNARKLSVVSRRRQIHQDDTSGEDTTISRRHTLSASQRVVLSCSGHGNVRTLVVRSRPRDPLF